jgi:nitrite reductase/ring-hydroxylating ferredoxin subunit
MTLQRVTRVDELWSGEMRSVRLENCTILLASIDGVVVAYEDRCAHKGLPVSDGALRGTIVTCNGHHWSYDLRDGHGVNPGSARLRALTVEIRDGEIWVDPATPARDQAPSCPAEASKCRAR